VGGRPTVNRHERLLFGERSGNLPRRVTFGLLASGESSRSHVVVHHGALLQLVPDRVRMSGAGCFEKLLKVIGRLQHLALQIALDNGDELFIRVANVLALSPSL
jgi:hypothetical protein